MTKNGFKLVSWNINGQVKNNGKHVEVLSDCGADIVALQKVRVSALKNL